MADKFVHYHVNINEDIATIRSLKPEDQQLINELAVAYGKLAESMSTVARIEEEGLPRKIGLWFAGVASVFVSGTVIIGCVVGAAWLIRALQGILNG